MTDVMIGSSQLSESTTAGNIVFLTNHPAALLGHLGCVSLLAFAFLKCRDETRSTSCEIAPLAQLDCLPFISKTTFRLTYAPAGRFFSNLTVFPLRIIEAIVTVGNLYRICRL